MLMTPLNSKSHPTSTNFIIKHWQHIYSKAFIILAFSYCEDGNKGCESMSLLDMKETKKKLFSLIPDF